MEGRQSHPPSRETVANPPSRHPERAGIPRLPASAWPSETQLQGGAVQVEKEGARRGGERLWVRAPLEWPRRWERGGAMQIAGSRSQLTE